MHALVLSVEPLIAFYYVLETALWEEARSQGSYTTFEYCLTTYPVTYLNTYVFELRTNCEVYETSYEFL